MLTVREAAERTESTESSVRVWLGRGRFPGAVLHNPVPGVSYWLIPESEVEQFEKQKPGPKPKAQKGDGKDKAGKKGATK